MLGISAASTQDACSGLPVIVGLDGTVNSKATGFGTSENIKGSSAESEGHAALAAQHMENFLGRSMFRSSCRSIGSDAPLQPRQLSSKLRKRGCKTAPPASPNSTSPNKVCCSLAAVSLTHSLDLVPQPNAANVAAYPVQDGCSALAVIIGFDDAVSREATGFGRCVSWGRTETKVYEDYLSDEAPTPKGHSTNGSWTYVINERDENTKDSNEELEDSEGDAALAAALHLAGRMEDRRKSRRVISSACRGLGGAGTVQPLQLSSKLWKSRCARSTAEVHQRD